jgi:hypothetical protein
MQTKAARRTHPFGTAGSSPPATARRAIGFRVVAALIALATGLTGGHNLVAGWTDPLDGGIHRLQDLYWGVAEGILLAAALAVQVRRPERHVAAMRIVLLAVVAQLLGAVASAALDPVGVVLLVLVLLAAVLHPARGTVLRPRVQPSTRLLVVALPAAVALVAFAGVQVAHHYTASSHDVLDAKMGWLGAAFACLGLALTLMAAALLPERKEPVVLAAIGLVILGVASILHPHVASSLGLGGGLLAFAVAAAVLVLARPWDADA